MPTTAISSDRINLIPNLKLYTVVSASLIVSTFFYAKEMTKSTIVWEKTPLTDGNHTSFYEKELNKWDLTDDTKTILTFLMEDFLCFWVVLNTVCCALVLLGRGLQKLVFGDLRLVEANNAREKFWNYTLYKFIFIFGVIKVDELEDIVVWLAWFGILGFLHVFSQLCKDRLHYLSSFPVRSPGWTRFKIMSTVSCLFSVSVFMIYLSYRFGLQFGYNVFFFMVAECTMLMFRTLHTMVKFAGDTPSSSSSSSSESRTGVAEFASASPRWNRHPWMAKLFGEIPFTYYALLGLELGDLSVDFLHHSHSLFWGNILLSMASVAICMHLRALYGELQRRIKKHRTYVWVMRHMEKEYPMATLEELETLSDNCAICWEKMESARKLPCNHFFHASCLQSWLEQDASCPTCRKILNISNNTRRTEEQGARLGRQITGLVEGSLMEFVNLYPGGHFFHFDGPRYISWLPRFSVEVTSAPPIANESQLESMARQVQQVFPVYPLGTIVENIRQTRSVQLTIENILEGRLRPTDMEGSAANADIEHRQQQQQQQQEDNAASTAENPFGQQGNSSQSPPQLPAYVPSSNNDSTPSAVGDKSEEDRSFAPQSQDREVMLKLRKEQIFLEARKRYSDRMRNEHHEKDQ